MGYASTKVRRGYGKGTNLANLPHDSNNNKAVKRVYKKAKKAPKSKVAENKDAVLVLARQVKQLQNRHYGQLQQRGMESQITAGQLSHAAPIAFGVNDMYNSMGVYAGTIVTGTPGFTQITTFNKYDYLSDIGEQFQWNPRQSQDQVSPIQYKPVFTRLNLQFNCKWAGPGPQGKIRVTYLKMKPHDSSDKLNVTLPATLGAYRNLAINPAQQERNAFNPRFHKVVYDQWVTFPNPCRTADEKANVQRRLSIPYKYDDTDLLAPDFDNHPTGQTYWTNTRIDKQLWCIISCNTEMDTALFTMSMQKLDSWRDMHGVKG